MKQPKIAILTHFNSFQAGYALSVGWLERAKMLSYFDQDFSFLVNESCPEDLYPNQKNVLKVLPKGKDLSFDEKVLFFRKNYRAILSEYDIILTADLIYQAKGNFLVWNQAMRQVDQDFQAQKNPKKWFHWIHSAWTDHRTVPHPDSLRFKHMPNSTLVYMNESEKHGVAKMYNTDIKNVACVYNPKDFRSFHNFDLLSWEITNILDIPNKDIIQVFPHCSTRMDAKGIMPVIYTFSELKKQGKSVALIFANANASKKEFMITHKKEVMKDLGLIEGEDYIFTSDLLEHKPCPRETVSNLFQISNLFVFGSWREVCPNVLLEAKISGNLLVTNEQLPCSREFAGEGAIFFSGTHKIPGKPDFVPGNGKQGIDRVVIPIGENDFRDLAKKIIKVIPSRKHQWEFCYENIWFNQMEPLLYGGSE